MCLSRVTMTFDNPSGLIEDGWKEFVGSGPALKFFNYGGTVVMDTWLDASKIQKPVEITANSGKKYMAGFHIYMYERSGQFTKGLPQLRRVYYRRVTCIGTQDGKDCAIAQEMYVPSDPNAWPPQETSPAPPAKKKLIDRVRGKK